MFPLCARCHILGRGLHETKWKMCEMVFFFFHCHMQWNNAIFFLHIECVYFFFVQFSSNWKLNWNIEAHNLSPMVGYFWARHAPTDNNNNNKNKRELIMLIVMNGLPLADLQNLYYNMHKFVYLACWIFAHGHRKTGHNKWVNFICIFSSFGRLIYHFQHYYFVVRLFYLLHFDTKKEKIFVFSEIFTSYTQCVATQMVLALSLWVTGPVLMTDTSRSISFFICVLKNSITHKKCFRNSQNVKKKKNKTKDIDLCIA